MKVEGPQRGAVCGATGLPAGRRRGGMPLAEPLSPPQEHPMTEDNLVLYLIVITFGLAIGFGAYQWFRANKAKREHHHSVAERQEGRDHPPVRAATGNVDVPQRKDNP
jgi:hypothetical protein